MVAGNTLSGVTQTITAAVTTTGTYFLSNTTNGVTFSGSGTFTSTGNQTVLLTASGIPTSVGTNNFAINTSNSCNFNRTVAANGTSNGSALVANWNCSTSSLGTLTAGVAATGVTQTVTASVTNIGTYVLSTVTNGVTFAATGTFAGTGSQTVVLTATGTPSTSGTNTFSLNTTNSCSFNRTVATNSSSNGTAVVTSWACSTASAGSMTQGIALSGVTQTITANVSSVGTYSITIITNGITFAGSGTFNATGSQTVLLTATGTPSVGGTFSFALNTSPTCSFSRPVVSQSSNGTAVISNWSTGSSVGTLTAGTAISGVTQSLVATVTTVGTYSITTTTNGITFAGSGTFGSIGSQTILLTATGNPTQSGSNTFTLNTSAAYQFTRTVNSPYTLGQSYGGGKIFYIDETGLHGLIYATPATQLTSPAWSRTTDMLTGATGVNIGTGASNTTAIINVQGNSGLYAAKLARDYRGGAYTDWFLPSAHEMKKLFDYVYYNLYPNYNASVLDFDGPGAGDQFATSTEVNQSQTIVFMPMSFYYNVTLYDGGITYKEDYFPDYPASVIPIRVF
jgi:hypothetical protein